VIFIYTFTDVGSLIWCVEFGNFGVWNSGIYYYLILSYELITTGFWLLSVINSEFAFKYLHIIADFFIEYFSIVLCGS